MKIDDHQIEVFGLSLVLDLIFGFLFALRQNSYLKPKMRPNAYRHFKICKLGPKSVSSKNSLQSHSLA